MQLTGNRQRYADAQATRVQQALERQQRQQLREEQEEAFNASLVADRNKRARTEAAPASRSARRPTPEELRAIRLAHFQNKEA